MGERGIEGGRAEDEEPEEMGMYGCAWKAPVQAGLYMPSHERHEKGERYRKLGHVRVRPTPRPNLFLDRG